MIEKQDFKMSQDAFRTRWKTDKHCEGYDLVLAIFGSIATLILLPAIIGFPPKYTIVHFSYWTSGLNKDAKRQ
jgi:hypothetical protein